MNIISMDSFIKKPCTDDRKNLKTNNKSKTGGRTVDFMHGDDINKIIVPPDYTIRQAMKAMDSSAMETILVVDGDKRLIGLLSDGDIRRALLNDASLDEHISKIMNQNFTAISYKTPLKDIVKLMKRHYFKQMPLVDENRKVVDIVLLKDIIAEKTRDNFVILMAGGLGSRLRPLTNEIPKPMLKIGDKPILEIIINQFKNHGFKNFIISINYLADIVEGYFGDGSSLDVNIQYVRETKRLGTAGCLKMVQDSLDKPFFVMNGDLLTKLDLDDMMKFHTANGFDMTIGMRMHEYQIPYGVINIDGNSVLDIIEKPVNQCVINAGIYCLNPWLIDYIPENEYFDITSLVELCINSKGKVGGYHIKDYWMDIGQIEDYNKANMDYEAIFKDNIYSSGKNAATT